MRHAPFANMPKVAFISHLKAAFQRTPPSPSSRIDGRFFDFLSELAGDGVSEEPYPSRLEARRHYVGWDERFRLFDECLRRLAPFQGDMRVEHAEALSRLATLHGHRAGINTPWQQLPTSVRDVVPKEVFAELFEARMFDYVIDRNSQTLVPTYTLVLTDRGRELIKRWRAGKLAPRSPETVSTPGM